MRFNRIFFIVAAILFCSGFRVYQDEQPWSTTIVSVDSPKIFVSYENADTVLANDVDTTDSLASDTSITVADAMTSILEDYNSIAGSWIQLVDTSDAEYSETAAAGKMIRVKNQATDAAVGGQAKFVWSDGNISYCEVSITDENYVNGASLYVGVTTHEIGHCLGLDHPQEITQSIMSYFKTYEGGPRLFADDKAGIVHLYPSHPNRAQESFTFGTSCATR